VIEREDGALVALDWKRREGSAQSAPGKLLFEVGAKSLG
jgi:hypothetical protein